MSRKNENKLLPLQVEYQDALLTMIRKELHDNIGQLLSAARALLGMTELQLANPPQTLFAANATLAKAVNELRSVGRSLDKEWLGEFNLVEYLASECTKNNTGSQLRFTFYLPERIMLEEKKQFVLSRIVLNCVELLQKFANATHIEIRIEDFEFSVPVTINVNGPEQKKDEHKDELLSIKKRIKVLAGHFKMTSDTLGSQISIHFPK